MSFVVVARGRLAGRLVVSGLAAVLALAVLAMAQDPDTGGGPQATSPTSPDGTPTMPAAGPGTGAAMARVIVEFADIPVVRVAGIPRDARQKLILDHPVAVAWRNRLGAQQQQFRAALATASPAAAVDWTYQLAFNGAAVRIPASDLPALAAMPGVKQVWPQQRYESTMGFGRTVTGAATLWGDPAIGGEANAGAGVKVAVLDTGIYIPHEMFNPAGYSYPASGGPWPKEGVGNEGLCTPKVIAARHFFRVDDPVNTSVDFDSALDGHSHGTHCAGTIGGVRISPNPVNGADPDLTGIAPACWLMAYKMLYESQKGEASVYDGEGLAALEAALADGADVISCSWGHAVTFNVTREPMVVTGSNLVAAGVVVVYANGNSRSEGASSLLSPACNPDVIAAAAAGNGNGYALWRLASFSSLGPDLDFSIKPDITSPGVNVVSSIHTGIDSLTNEYASYSGTSMACPHTAGCCALLKQVHPGWTPAQVKSALMTTAGRNTVMEPDNSTPAVVNSAGAGHIKVDAAADPGITVDKPSVSFGLMRNTDSASVDITLTNLNGTDETFTIALNTSISGPGAAISVTPTTSILVPANGTATLTLAADATGIGASTGEQEGEVLLSGDQGHTAHIIWWLRAVPATGATPLLLIDYDQNSGSDYQSVYTTALTAAGITHDVWDVAAQGRFPNYYELMAYRAVLLYTGEYTGSANWNVTVASRFLQWIYDGRSFAALGRSLPGLIEPRPFGKVMQMRTDGSTDLYSGAIPAGSIVGQNGTPFAGLTFDLGTSGGGDNANFNTQLLELPPEYIFIAGLSTPALLANGAANANYNGEVALWRRANPDINNPDVPADFPYRVLYCTFGLESISDNTGFSTKQAFAGALGTWLTENVTVDLDATINQRDGGATVSVNGLGGATVSSVLVNFGDGSAPVSAPGMIASHTYTANGTFNVIAAVTTSTGLTYVSASVQLVAQQSGGSGGGGCGAPPADGRVLPWPLALLVLGAMLGAVRRRA